MWLVGVVSRRWVWLVGVGGIYGCGFKEIYRFPHTTYPLLLLYLYFLQQHPYFFVHFLKCFSFFIYILYNIQHQYVVYYVI